MLLLQINAMANKAAGKGYESTDFYENVKFQFVGIENIHVMRQSLQKMTECKCTWKKIIKTAILVFTFGRRLKCAQTACMFMRPGGRLSWWEHQKLELCVPQVSHVCMYFALSFASLQN